MSDKNVNLDGEDEVMRRCRRVRNEINRRFKSVEEMYAWLVSLEKQPEIRRGARTGTDKARRPRKATRARAVKRRAKTAPAPHV